MKMLETLSWKWKRIPENNLNAVYVAKNKFYYVLIRNSNAL